MGLIDKLNQRIELYKLEQRYTRRKGRRTAVVSDAQYIDGEYVQSNSAIDNAHRPVAPQAQAQAHAQHYRPPYPAQYRSSSASPSRSPARYSQTQDGTQPQPQAGARHHNTHNPYRTQQRPGLPDDARSRTYHGGDHRASYHPATATAPSPASYSSPDVNLATQPRAYSAGGTAGGNTVSDAEKARDRLVRIREIVAENDRSSRRSTYGVRDGVVGGGRDRDQVLMMGGVTRIGAR